VSLPLGGQGGSENQKVRFVVVLRFTHLPPRRFVHFLYFYV
jgi:hypothetical protein